MSIGKKAKSKATSKDTKKEPKVKPARITISDEMVRNVIKNVISSKDHRMELLALISTLFLESAIIFFGKVANAKLHRKAITVDWYKETFLASDLAVEDLILNSGLAQKSYRNTYKSVAKKNVINVTEEHYNELLRLIGSFGENMTSNGQELEVNLTLKLNNSPIDLTISESLLVINILAIKYLAIRGGVWSSVGLQVEKRIVETLCKIYEVPAQHYDQNKNPPKEGRKRQVDFYLTDNENNKCGCEVKLQGRGNPESADGALARPDVKVFIFDTLSEKSKIWKQLEDRKDITPVQLSLPDGYKQFENVLKRFSIPYTPLSEDVNIEELLEKILPSSQPLIQREEILENVEDLED
jgi:CfrBI restriction endonuclease